MDGESLASGYIDICKELGCKPSLDLLHALAEDSSQLELTGFESPEQLHATASLLEHTNIRELGCTLELDASGWTTLLEACIKCPSVHVISLKGCGLGAVGGGEQQQQKLAALLGACNLDVLDLSRNGLGDAFVRKLATTPLLASDRLAVLDASDNTIGCDGAAALAAALAASGADCALKQLDLSFNHIGDRGAVALADVVAGVPLAALELEGNQVGRAGGMALASSLRRALALQRLNLNHNAIGGDVLAAMADALRVNSRGSLRELALAGCGEGGGGGGGGDEGVTALLRAAAGSRELQLLDVRGTRLGSRAIAAAAALLRSPAPLVTLRLDVATRDAAEQLAQALAGNTRLLQLMIAGPVPEHVLRFVEAALTANAQRAATTGTEDGGGAALAASSGPSRTPSPSLAKPRTPVSAGSSSGGGAGRVVVNSGGGGGGSVRSSRNSSLAAGRAAAAAPGAGSTNGGSSSGGGGAVLWSSGGLSGGGAAQRAADVFRRHDADGSGTLDREELLVALQELGVLEGLKARQLGKVLGDAMKEADANGDGRVSLDEFVLYYQRLARANAESARRGRISARRRQVVVPVSAAGDEVLRKLFKAYCRLRVGHGRQVGDSVQHMNSAQFSLLARDARLVEPRGPLSSVAVDIVFTRCKLPGTRRLALKEFLEAIALLADEAGTSFEGVVEALATAATPPSSAAGNVSGDGGRAQHQHPTAAGGARRPVSAGPIFSSAAGGLAGPQLRLPAGRLEAKPSAGGQQPPWRPSSLKHQSTVGRTSSNPLFELDAAAVGGGGSGDGGGSQGGGGSRESRGPSGGGGGGGEAAAAALQVLEARLGALERRAVMAELKECAQGVEAAAGCRSGVSLDLLQRVEQLEGSHARATAKLDRLVQQCAALQDAADRAAGRGAAGEKLALLEAQVQQLSRSSSQRADRVLGGGADGTSVAALDRKLSARHERVEAALMQVARQVDALDMRLREEQEGSLKALEAILGSASAAPSGATSPRGGRASAAQQQAPRLRSGSPEDVAGMC